MQTNNGWREALTKILNLTNSLDENCAVDPVEIRDIARAALAAPRNCDVGTEEEQVLRWRGFCAREKGGVCDGCPCLADDGVEACFAKWEQTPYEEKEGGAECAPAREVRNAMEA